jgi:Zn-dependent protease
VNFTNREIVDLTKAWIGVTLAFQLLGFTATQRITLTSFISTSVIVGGAVILHELGHKYTAQKYGYPARFHSNDLMLAVGVLMAFTGFIFLAPGAVHVRGIRDMKANGFIAWAGPAVNLVLSVVGYALYYAVQSPYFLQLAWINALLGAFNMIPFPGFDGEKIWRGDRTLYIATTILLVLLLAARFL